MTEDVDYKEHILRANKLIEIELKHWEDIGATPQNITVDTFIMDAYINSLASFLVEKGIIDDEEFTFHFKKRLLDNLINAREKLVEPAMAEMRRQEIINGTPAQDIPKKRRLH